MGVVYFYHLTDTPLDRTLPMLLGKARAAGWRVLVRGQDLKLLERLDQILWKDGFLPHGLAGGPHDTEQPVLLGTAVASEGFDCIMSVGGGDVSPAEVEAMDRTCILFDGHDETALAFAREQWKMLTSAHCAAQYWAQEDGRWAKKAEK